MDRPSTAVGLQALGLALACSVAGCGTPGSTTAHHGTILTVTNDTSMTVTMRSCPDASAQAAQCTADARIAPGGAAEFPLSGPPAYLVRQVVITGFGGQTRCFIIPSTNLTENVLATVTEAQHSLCTGRYGGSPPLGP